jgi:CRISPR/Cas system-associated endoribonuclease Cas2
MRYRAVITEIFLIQVSFFEVRMNRAAFELLRKDTSRKKKVDDIGDRRE